MLPLIESFKSHIWTVVISLFVFLITAASFEFYIIKYRFPDLEKSVEKSRIEQKESQQEYQTQISKKLDENSKFLLDNSKLQEERINKAEGSISTLKVSLLGLMNKVGKAPTETQLKALISSTNEFGAIKSASLKEAKFSNVSDQLPSTQNFQGWAGVASNLGLDVPQKEIVQGTKEPEQIKTLFTRALVSDNPLWKVENSKLSVKYDNGSILFTPKSDMSAMELQELANELNGVKDSLSPQSLGIKTWLKPSKKQ
jgi:hypothetical protein